MRCSLGTQSIALAGDNRFNLMILAMTASFILFFIFGAKVFMYIIAQNVREHKLAIFRDPEVAIFEKQVT